MFFINHTDLEDGTSAIIEIDGFLNSESAPDFEEYITRLIDKNVNRLIIDMKELAYISSEGIGATLLIQKSISEKNGLAIFFNLNKEVLSLFKLLGFDKVFTIADDRAEAIDMIDRHIELYPENASAPEPQTENTGEDFLFDDEFHEPGISETEAVRTDDDDFTFFDETGSVIEPFVIECIKCSSLIRVNEPGEHICPYCDAEFTVAADRKAVFKIADNE